MGLAVTGQDLNWPSGIFRRAAVQGSIAQSTPTAISWDTEDRDIGGWLSVPGTDLVVPAGADGLYLVALSVVWDGVATNAAQREIWVDADGVAYGHQRYDPFYNADHKHTTAAIVEVVGGDVIKGVMEHGEIANQAINSARVQVKRIG